MGIDINSEDLLPLSAAARLLPPMRRGRPVSTSCLFRWIADGVKTPGGEVVRLEAIRMGGRWLTSKQALQRFAERQTPEREGQQTIPRSPTSRQRAVERANRQLESLGI
ncbi:hypothetical protein AYO40_03080 [Planctomycetaceae bacterium SCGC AG-212-D15]|nr:hypothetical protein AYO40_03080 [Planctomycetaceae bacterium SCGC AG-212-D15]